MLRVVSSLDDSDSGDVPDPYGLDDGAYDHALDLIENACDALVSDLAAELGSPATSSVLRS